jgi:mRNA interferase MazF
LATKSGDEDVCPQAGDLIWMVLDPTVGHEQSGRRLALVLTAHAYNVVSCSCVACPVTRSVRGYPFEVAIPEGVGVSGVVLADQMRSVSWQKRHVQRIAPAPTALLDDVRERVAALLAID